MRRAGNVSGSAIGGAHVARTIGHLTAIRHISVTCRMRTAAVVTRAGRRSGARTGNGRRNRRRRRRRRNGFFAVGFLSLQAGERRSQNERNDAHQFDENVNRRTGRIFERIADRIAHDGGFVRFAAFSAVIAAFDVFLRVIPRAAGIRHKDCQNDAGNRRADQKTAQNRTRRIEETGDDRRQNGDNPGQYHLFDGSFRRNIDAFFVIGLNAFFAFQEAGDFFELTPDFDDHVLGAAADGEHGERAEPEGQNAADEETDDDERVHCIDRRQFHDLRIGDKKRERRQSGRTDGETFADCGRRIADAVEFIGAFADFFFQTAHFGNAAGIVGNRAIGVDRKLNARRREHAQRSERDAVKTRAKIRKRDRDANQEDGNNRRNHADRKTADDVRRRPCRRSFGNGFDRFIRIRRIIFRDFADERTGNQTARDGEENHHCVDMNQTADRMFPNQAFGGQNEIGRAVCRDCRQNGRRNRTAIEGVLGIRFFVFAADDKRAQNAENDADGGNDERQDDGRELSLIRRPKRRAQNRRTDDGADVRFEQVGAHAGDVADVVADVIGDNGRIARIVFGDARFDFAHEVGAHVGGFRVNAAAHARKQCNRRCAEAKARKNFEDLVHAFADKNDVRIEQEQANNAQKPETDDRHAHDGAAAECDGQGVSQPLAGGVRRADIGFCRHAHAEKSCRCAANRADDKRNRHPRTAVDVRRIDNREQCRDDDDEYRKHFVFGFQKCHRAFLNIRRNGFHAIRAGFFCRYRTRLQK